MDLLCISFLLVILLKAVKSHMAKLVLEGFSNSDSNTKSQVFFIQASVWLIWGKQGKVLWRYLHLCHSKVMKIFLYFSIGAHEHRQIGIHTPYLRMGLQVKAAARANPDQNIGVTFQAGKEYTINYNLPKEQRDILHIKWVQGSLSYRTPQSTQGVAGNRLGGEWQGGGGGGGVRSEREGSEKWQGGEWEVTWREWEVTGREWEVTGRDVESCREEDQGGRTRKTLFLQAHPRTVEPCSESVFCLQRTWENFRLFKNACYSFPWHFLRRYQTTENVENAACKFFAVWRGGRGWEQWLSCLTQHPSF